MYASVRIAGQPMTSAVIDGHDSFSFPNPNAPFTWIKAVPALRTRASRSSRSRSRSDASCATGTDDDVYLRIGPNLRFALDKRLYNDFERGDRDTYSVPIDDAVLAGLRSATSSACRSRSRPTASAAAGLGGVKLSSTAARSTSRSIKRWLEDDHRTWRAPASWRGPGGPRSRRIRLDEDDFVYGGDDQGDIDPFDRRASPSATPRAAAPDRPRAAAARRPARRRRRGEITYRSRRSRPTRPRRAAAAVPPDLVITEFFFGTVTVRNQGAGAAGPFRLRAGNAATGVFQSYAGLAAGASETRALTGLACEGAYVAAVDDLGQVAESDETNNSRNAGAVIC